ncbi:type 1 fimbrial protein [Acinetobacter sp. I-MWF]|uniref:fimbrial protein n=1 Tax=Acinetobacter sp. I-MWF TaxID=2940517 RepID=UPI0021C77A4B|nr:fimbrial protein [Acinetobacter sp. I-MWF]MCT9979081.1 type 1 fimbrial protein [Acinetobacter sp. I-MWF]
MKKLSLSILSALALSLAYSNVFAVDGTITVNGVVTDQTCTLRGGYQASGVQDITVNLPAVPKSTFRLSHPMSDTIEFTVVLANADGTGSCDAATTNAFKGLHLSTISPTDLHPRYKTLLVNKATGGASVANPIFIQIVNYHGFPIDFSAAWGTQAPGKVHELGGFTYIRYLTRYYAVDGVADAQNVQATVNYTMHYN